METKTEAVKVAAKPAKAEKREPVPVVIVGLKLPFFDFTIAILWGSFLFCLVFQGCISFIAHQPQ